MKLEDVQPGTILEFGAYGPMEVESIETTRAGWNGKVRVTRVRFTTGLGFMAGAESEARLVESANDEPRCTTGCWWCDEENAGRCGATCDICHPDTADVATHLREIAQLPYNQVRLHLMREHDLTLGALHTAAHRDLCDEHERVHVEDVGSLDAEAADDRDAKHAQRLAAIEREEIER